MKRSVFVILSLILAGILTGCTITIRINESSPKEAAPAEEPKRIVTDEELLEKAEKARIANPWGETQSLGVVSEWAGFDFKPPADKITLEDGSVISLTTYRYMTGTAEALYETGDSKLIFRQSRDMQGISLAGDQNTYSSEWKETVNGHEVYCFGDKDTINLAYYDSNEDHFSVSFNCGKEGEGLTFSDLSEIISE